MAFKNSVGAYAYRVYLRKKRDYKVIDMSKDSLGERLRNRYKEFIEENLEPEDHTDTARRWFFDKYEKNQNSFDSYVRYGRTGFTSELVDYKTREVQYNRAPSDLEIIPLYNKLWIPDEGPFGIWMFQAFSGSSCNNMMSQSFIKFWREKCPELMLTMPPIVPEEIRQYKMAPVKAVILKAKSGGSDIATRHLGTRTEEASISVEFAAPEKEDLGTFALIMERFTGKEKGQAMSGEGVEYEQAYAKVKINGRTRKVALAGVSSRTGLIDLTDDVKMKGGHPTKGSISREFERIIKDIAQDMADG